MSRVRVRMVSRIAKALSSREFLRSSGFFTGLNLGIGALVGAVIVSFIVVTEWLTEVMIHGQALGAVRFAAPVLGALAAGFLMHRWFGEARGSGIPQTKAALVANDGRIPFRTAFGKYVCGVLTLGAGIPLGREGPSAQIGAGIASSVGEALGLDTEQRRQLIPVGTAAAIAAAFNTPIAAILFSLEEIVGNLHARVLGSVVLSAVASWLVLRLSLGDEPLFSVPAYELGHPAELLIYAVLGVLGGLMSVGFVRTLLWLRVQMRRLPLASRWFQPALGGVAVAAAWLLLPGFFEVGYGPVGEALAGELPIGRMAVLLAIHLVLVVVAYASGNAGGIFGPSIFLGAMLGGVVGSVANLWFDFASGPGPYALVGMGAAFAGILRVPMASVFMIFEITQSYAVIVPLMIANLTSFFVSRRLQRVSVYEALAAQDGIQLPSTEDEEPHPVVRAAMRPPRELLPPDLTVEDAIERVALSGKRTWPVAEGNRISGLITLAELERFHAWGQDQDRLGDLVRGRKFPHAHADQPIDHVLATMGRIRMDTLPVVSRVDVHQLEAVVTVSDLLRAYGIAPGAGSGPPRGIPG